MKLQLVMNTDMRLLIYTALVCIVMWVPYICAAVKAFGLKRMAGANGAREQIERFGKLLLESLQPGGAPMRQPCKRRHQTRSASHDRRERMRN